MKTKIYLKASLSDGVIHCHEIDSEAIKCSDGYHKYIYDRLGSEYPSHYRLGVDFFLAEFDAFEAFNAARASGIRTAERKLAKLSGLKAKVENHLGDGK